LGALLDDDGVETRFSDGRSLRISWDALAHVALVWRNRDDRFFWEDSGYWELQSLDGTRCTIYRREAKRIGLIDRLARLPGFSRAEAERALREDRGYTRVWRRDSVRCSNCGGAMAVEPESGLRRWDTLLRCANCGHTLPLGREKFDV
jgi:hypothetical protein